MKCLFLSIQPFGAPRSKQWQCFVQKWPLPQRENKVSWTLRHPQRSHCPVFSPICFLSPLSLSAECQVYLGLKVISFLISFGFHVVLSNSCLWLSPFVFARSSQCFGPSRATAAGCPGEKRRKCCFCGTGQREWGGRKEEEKAAATQLPHLTVGGVCVCVWVSVFLCANWQQAEATERDGSRV